MRKLLLTILPVMLLAASAFGQGRQVTGVVSGADGPIAGVTVVVEGATGGTTTDLSGRYTISAPSDGSLSFTFIGMEPQTVAIAGRAIVNVTMAESSIQAEEVYVIAYGTASKEAFTGSASQIGSERLSKLQVSNISRALEGAAPGVQVANTSGQPGASSTIRIRGIGSIEAGADPLYVVDGVPYGGSINAINPADVESITVLKDAASTALYGARAANGVIMITTKKGSSYQPKVTFDARVGINSRGIPEYDVMKNPGEYLTTFWQARKNMLGGNGAAASAGIIAQLGGYNPYNVADDQVVDANGRLTSASRRWYDDWTDEAFRTGIRQEYNVTISGGSDRSSHFLSAGYLDDEGIIANSNFNRFSVRSSGDYQVNDFVKLNGNVAYSRGEQNTQNPSGLGTMANVFSFTQNIAPIYPVYGYDQNGNRVYDEDGDPVYDFGDGTFSTSDRVYNPNQNPLATDDANQYQTLRDDISSRFGATVTFLKDFTLQANIGYDLISEQDNRFMTPSFGDAQTVGGRGYKYRTRQQTMTINQLLTYAKTCAEHNFDVLAGHETYQMDYDRMYAQKTGFFEPTVPQFDNAITMQAMQSWAHHYSIESYFGRFNYDYADKYYFSASLRTDGSSRFAKENRWGTFWSVGGSWRISQEGFMSDVDWVDNLSLRASYGSVGNDDIRYPAPNGTRSNYYADRTQYSVSNSDGAFAVTKFYQGNPDLTWETSNNFNVGVSAALWQGLLDIDVEYFYKKTKDMLYNVPQSSSSGVQYLSQNALTMNNKGLEFTLGVNIPMPEDFRWNWTITGTHYKNEVTDIPADKQELGITRGRYNIREGRSVYDFYFYKFAGLDENGKSLWYKDVLDGNGKPTGNVTKVADYTTASKYFIGTAIPDLVGGITTDFAWKGLDLSIAMNYQLGGDFEDYIYTNLMHAGENPGSNWHRDILNAWTPENRNTNVPILDGDQNASTFSDRFLIKASYFNLRNITLGYTFPKHWLSSAGIANARVYVAADNVALFSKRKGMDPRQYISGTNDYNYSALRTVSVGLSLNF